MMRIKKGFWLWGIFSNEDRNYLEKIKNKVQEELPSPKFETHITLAGPYLKINKNFIKGLKLFTDNNHKLVLDIKGFDFKKEKFESFYIDIYNSEKLKK